MKQDSIAKLALSRGLSAMVDIGDYEWLSQFPWRAYWNRHTRSYCAMGRPFGKHAMLARFILGVVDKSLRVDHINHDTLDNRRQNLRVCTNAQNAANARPRLGASAYKGVTYLRANRKWQAGIRVLGKKRYLGSFTSEVEAAKAYDVAARAGFGEYAYLNFALPDAREEKAG